MSQPVGEVAAQTQPLVAHDVATRPRQHTLVRELGQVWEIAQV